MIVRIFFMLCMVLACSAPTLGQTAGINSNAGAQPSAANTIGPGANSSHSQGLPGNGSGGQQSNQQGNGGNPIRSHDGNSQSGQSPRSETPPTSDGSGQTSGEYPQARETLSPDQARDAVERRQAMPLSELSNLVRERTGGEVVDADLLRVDRMFIYALRVLDGSDRLSIQYYHARSGIFIGSQ